MRTILFYIECEEEEIYLLFFPELFFSTYNLFAFLNPLAITFPMSSYITLHLVDVNIIICPLSSILPIDRMPFFCAWNNNASIVDICISSLALPFRRSFVGALFPRIIYHLCFSWEPQTCSYIETCDGIINYLCTIHPLLLEIIEQGHTYLILLPSA